MSKQQTWTIEKVVEKVRDAGDLAFPPLLPGRFARRLNRFVAEVEVGGKPMLAHVPNSGRMKELFVPGVQVLVEHHTDNQRKTGCSLALVAYQGRWVSIDSRLPNKLFEAGLRRGFWSGFAGPGSWRREVTYGGSRFDGLWEDRQGKLWVEVKSVTLVEDSVARFPDAPTERGRKHLLHLQHAVEKGDRAMVVFIVQRDDAKVFKPNWLTDPDFAQALVNTAKAGVLVQAANCLVDAQGIQLIKEIPIELGR